MKTFRKSGIALTVAALSTVLTFSAAQASYAEADGFIDYARVKHVESVYETVVRSVPKEHCWNERVKHSRHYSGHSSTPVLLGALIGGALGNELGHHKRNKQVGAVVGGLLGGSIGRDIQRESGRHTDQRQRYSTVERCEVDYQRYEQQQLIGYDVTYHYRGNDYHTQTSEHPGKKLPIKVSFQPAV